MADEAEDPEAMHLETKFRCSADAELIELVRTRPVLYNTAHSRYMDIPLKAAMWQKIGRELRISPDACKTRWYNIRDQYRKNLRRRKTKRKYKYAHLLGFMDLVYQGQFESSPVPAVNTSAKAENSEESNDAGEPEVLQAESPNHDDDIVELQEEPANHDEDVVEIQTKSPNHDVDLEELQTKPANQDDPSEADAVSVCQSESVLDFEMFEKSTVAGSFSSRPTPQAVDEFFAAIGPTLKALSPYLLSQAKAEIFAVVHKYELKSIVQNGWTPPNVNPLP